MGASYKDKYAGTFGVMGTFSSFFSHHISTMEGGCVVTDDEELCHILLCLRAHGWTRDLPRNNKVTGVTSEDQFEESFKFVLPGYNVRPLEMSGAIGVQQLKKLPSFVKNRIRNAQYFLGLFDNHPLVEVQKEIGVSSWFGFSMILRSNDSSVSRSSVVSYLTENGVECRPIVGGNFVKNEAVKYFDYEISGTLTNADRVDQSGFFVGNHHFDIKDKIRYLRDLIDNIRS